MIQRTALQTALLVPCLVLLGCSSSDPGGTAPTGTGGAGGMSTGTGGTGGGGGSGGQTGTGGASGTGGSGGAEPGGSGGSGGGTGGADASVTEVAPEVAAEVAGGETGITDPGTAGNGRFMIARPAVPPEATGNPTGMMRNFQTGSSVLPARGGTVYIPAGHVATQPTAFMVFHDGGAYSGTFKMPVIFDKLIAAKKIPMMIGIFIPPSGNRSGEYDTVSDRFGRFVIADVLPRVEALGIKLTTDPEASGTGGHSSGGICAFTMAWFHNDRFRRVLSNSGSFLSLQNPGGDMYDMLVRNTMPKKVIRTAMTAGTNDLSCCGTTWYAANDKLHAALTAGGYNARYLVIQGGSHDQNSPMPTGPEQMEWLWRGYPVTGPTR